MAGKRAAPRDHIVARQAEAVGQDQPALDAAGLLAEAVVIVDAMDPFAAQLAIMHAADEGGVLARHRLLIAIAVERPGLHLALVELAAVQQLMKRMLVVIALGADGADRGLEFGGRPERRKVVRGAASFIARTSMPSSPIVQPAARGARARSNAASSTGLELLMWTNTFRSTPSVAKAAIEPSGRRSC